MEILRKTQDRGVLFFPKSQKGRGDYKKSNTYVTECQST